MKRLALLIAVLGTSWCIYADQAGMSTLPLFVSFLLFKAHRTPSPNAPHGDKTFSPDTTFADEGNFEDVPCTKIESEWALQYEDFEGHGTQREITLKALRKKQHHYYLLAFCHEKKALRSFRLDRILSATDMKTGEVFDNRAKLYDFLTATPAPDSPFRGKRIAVNWPLVGLEYWDVRRSIETLGAILHGGNVTADVDFVIAGDKSEQKKVLRARKLGIKVLSEAEWLDVTASLLRKNL